MPIPPTFRQVSNIRPKSPCIRRAGLIVMVSLLWPLLAALPSHAQASFPLSQFNPWTFGETDASTSVAWGDMDGDGELDLAVGNAPTYDLTCFCDVGGENKVYRSQNGTLDPAAFWTSADTDRTTSIAWGDVDGDGDLDLAVGNKSSPNKVYLNQNGVLQTTAAWTSPSFNTTHSVAWGDVDSDGDLDLAVGNYGSNKVYLNDHGVLETTASWSSNEENNNNNTNNTSVAWGDVDRDGDLDLAVGNDDANKLYLNNNGVLEISAGVASLTGPQQAAFPRPGSIGRPYRHPEERSHHGTPIRHRRHAA